MKVHKAKLKIGTKYASRYFDCWRWFACYCKAWSYQGIKKSITWDKVTCKNCLKHRPDKYKVNTRGI